MIPVYDRNRLQRVPYVTWSLIAVCILIFLWEKTLSSNELYDAYLTYGVVPRDFSFPNLISSLFIHGGWFHLGFNMLYLWIFGDDLEDALGWWLFLALYVVFGILAMLAQVMIYPNSAAPIIGASGAIAGVMGAYYVLFPRSIIRCITIRTLFDRDLTDIPATLVLIFWFLIQILGVTGSMGGKSSVAFFAHLGGFAAGYFIMKYYVQNAPFARIAPYYQQYPTTPPSPGMTGQDWQSSLSNLFSRGGGTGEIFKSSGSARSPGPSRFRWRSDSQAGKSLQDAENKIIYLREKLGATDSPGEDNTAKKDTISGLESARVYEFEDLDHLERLAQIMKLLNSRRGQIVRIVTDGKVVHEGLVVTLSGKRVVLRNYQDKVIPVSLKNIMKLWC